jgi:hypothetical protein
MWVTIPPLWGLTLSLAERLHLNNYTWMCPFGGRGYQGVGAGYGLLSFTTRGR